MGTALAFFLFYEGSNLFFAYFHLRFCTFEIQAFRHQKTAPQRGFLSEYLFYIHRMEKDNKPDTMHTLYQSDNVSKSNR